jgi:hypothetical protein
VYKGSGDRINPEGKRTLRVLGVEGKIILK